MTKRFVTSSHWGPGVAEVDDGELISVGPHPNDPDPSPINGNFRDSVYGTARVRRPAVRRSYLENGPLAAPKTRGEELFIEVTWDQALDLIAGDLKRVYASHGSSAIYGGSYGWSSAGRFHHAQSQLKRFLTAAGGFVRSEGNYSYNAALVLMPHIVGNFREHVKEATRWRTVAEHGQLVVMFGGVPLRNTQVSGGGIHRHDVRDQMLECAQAGVEFVNISPLRTDAIEEINAEWIAPRPGSDTAIMMGLAHTIYSEGLHDQRFLDRCTVGFDKVAAYLTGSTDGVVKDADWAAGISGMPAERIRSLARQLASERTLICTSVSLQRADFGEQPLWMTVTLAAMLGQIGLPGGGYGIGYGADSAIGTIDRPMPWPSFPQGDNPQTDFVPVATVSDMLLNPGGAYDYNGEERTYPDIRLVWWAGGNPFHHHQDINRLRMAFQKPETIIVNEINWTASARHADIVLPVAASLERTDFGAGTQDNAVIPMPRAIEPVGQAREEFWIYCELERRLALEARFSAGKTARQWLDGMWCELRDTAQANGYDIPELETFLAGDIIRFDDPDPQAVFLAEFVANPEANPLPTPSGKIELFSKVIDGFGYDDCPGQATWIAPREWLGAPQTQQFPLHLISGQPGTRLHSQYDNGAYSLSRKVQGREPVLINPKDAADRGISDGDIVTIHNERGSCLAGAIVTDDIRERVVFLWTGAWYDPDFTQADHRDNHGNPNALSHDLRTSRLSQGPAAHSVLVEVTRYEGNAPAVKVFEAPVCGSGD